MTKRLVIGIDPGPLPGLCAITTDRAWAADLAQTSPKLLTPLVTMLCGNALSHDWAVDVCVEKFVVGHRATRSASAKAGELTRQQIGGLRESLSRRFGGRVSWTERPAGVVKPWATDERLEAVGLMERTKGMRHCRDACRHALFGAVRTGACADPLSDAFTMG